MALLGCRSADETETLTVAELVILGYFLSVSAHLSSFFLPYLLPMKIMKWKLHSPI